MKILTSYFEKYFSDKDAKNFLSQKLFIYPTETFYALGCRADCDNSIQKIYKLKKRSEQNPLLLLCDSYEMVQEYALVKNNELKKLVRGIGEGCTFILNSKKKLSSKLNLINQTLAFRVTTHPVARKLIKLADIPLVGTSANLSGSKAVCNWQELPKLLTQAVDFIFDNNPTKGGKASTILDFSYYPKVRVVRDGKYSIEIFKKLLIKNKINLKFITS